jgi:hypothetical protein
MISCRRPHDRRGQHKLKVKRYHAASSYNTQLDLQFSAQSHWHMDTKTSSNKEMDTLSYQLGL